MFRQPADERMMIRNRRRDLLVARDDRLVLDDSLIARGIGCLIVRRIASTPHLVDVLLGARNEIADVESPLLRRSHPIDDKLQRPLVTLGPPSDAEKPAFGNRVVLLLRRAPEPAQELPRSVGQHKVDIKRAVGRRPQVLLGDEEDLVLNQLAGLEFRDKAPRGGRWLCGTCRHRGHYTGAKRWREYAVRC